MARSKINTDWIPEALRLLRDQKGSRPGWGYRASSMLSAEPTVLAALAIHRPATGSDQPEAAAILKDSADWLVRLQATDGSVAVAENLPSPRWCTAHATLLWSLLGGYDSPMNTAADWLCRCQPITFRKDPEGPFGDDTTLVGWPWVEGTYSWVEPTSWAILALRSAGRGQHARVQQGIRLISDRAVSSGGWNFGNSAVFGTSLRASPDTTGLALMALGGVSATETGVIRRALAYLEGELPKLRSPRSLGLGLLGWRAWRDPPLMADRWLERSFASAVRRPDVTPPDLAYLLLAVDDRLIASIRDQENRVTQSE